MRPQVWNLRDPNCPEDAEYCGRGTQYGNPYVIGIDGNRDDVCDKFERRVLPDLDVRALEGKDLKCHCKPKRCHCDPILVKANPLLRASI